MIRYLLLCFAIICSACSQSDVGNGMVLTDVPSPNAALPYTAVPYTATPVKELRLSNLRVLSARNSYVPITSCMSDEHVVWIEILNEGSSDSGTFTLRFNDIDIIVEGLIAGEQQTLEVPFNNYYHSFTVEIDSLNDVWESDETDNILQSPVWSLTPPVFCTQTSTPIPVQTSYTPTPSPFVMTPQIVAT